MFWSWGKKCQKKIWLNDTHCTNYGTNLKGYQPLLTGTDHANQSRQQNNLFPHWGGGAHGPPRALQGVTQGERSAEAPEGTAAPPTAPRAQHPANDQIHFEIQQAKERHLWLEFCHPEELCPGPQPSGPFRLYMYLNRQDVQNQNRIAAKQSWNMLLAQTEQSSRRFQGGRVEAAGHRPLPPHTLFLFFVLSLSLFISLSLSLSLFSPR